MWNKSKISLNLFLVVVVCLVISIEATTTTKKQKVCIIGAGASGLASAKQLAEHTDEFDIVAFERNSDVGGIWLYTDDEKVDAHNLPVNSGVYKNLRTNFPKEIMAFPDYREFYDPEGRSCVKHETVLSYLKNYTKHFNLGKYIQLNTLVEKVTPIHVGSDWRSTKFVIKKRNLDTNKNREVTCDAVMVCNGHFSDPNIPKIPGIETFPGKVIHSLNYRRPEGYHDQIVVILGASNSGIDIAIDIAQYAKTVYLSHNKPKREGLKPDSIIQVAGVVGANGNKLLLKDGSTIKADAFIFCTGYRYTYPFLDKSSKIKVDDNHVIPLYKHLINVEHPKMSLIGVPKLALNFLLFHYQAKYVVALLQGKVQLPSKSGMMLDSLVPRGTPKRYAHALGPAQWTYYEDLARAAGFKQLAPKWYREIFEAWVAIPFGRSGQQKKYNVQLKKDGSFKIYKALRD